MTPWLLAGYGWYGGGVAGVGVANVIATSTSEEKLARGDDDDVDASG